MANSISIGQAIVDEKSNEIGANPKLLEMRELKGAIVTIDAMGCQTEIAKKIIDRGGHYVLNVKGNQPTLRDGVEQVFSDFLEGSPPKQTVRSSSTTRKAHGSKESRRYYVCPVPQNLPDRERWPSLKAIAWRLTMLLT